MTRKEEYEWYKAHHICTDCHRRDAFNNFTLCEYCLEKRQNRSLNYVMTEESKEKKRKREKELRDYRKQNGLCVICGRKALKGHTLCTEHNAKNNTRTRENYRKKHPYIENKCLGCTNQCVPGKKFCPECLEKAQKKAEYMRSFIDRANHPWKETIVL